MCPARWLHCQRVSVVRRSRASPMRHSVGPKGSPRIRERKPKARSPPGPPDQPGVHPCWTPPPHLDQASSSSSLPPEALPQPETYSQNQKDRKVPQPFRNDHTGDLIWCEGTIQYRLQDLGPNAGVQIRVTRHRQKALDQGSRPPDKPPWSSTVPNHSDTSHPRTRRTGAPSTPANCPQSGARASAHHAYPSTHHPAKGPWAPILLPDEARAGKRRLLQPRPAPSKATFILLELKQPAITYSKDATAALQGLPMAQGTEWVSHLLTFQKEGLQREDPLDPASIYDPDQKAYKCNWHKGTPLYARAASTPTSSTS